MLHVAKINLVVSYCFTTFVLLNYFTMSDRLTPHVVVKQRDSYSIVEIQMPNDNVFRITAKDNTIEVLSLEGGIIIEPKVTNVVIIKSTNG